MFNLLLGTLCPTAREPQDPWHCGCSRRVNIKAAVLSAVARCSSRGRAQPTTQKYIATIFVLLQHSPLSQPPLFIFAIPSSTVQDGSSHPPKSKSHTNYFLHRRRQPSFRPTCDAVPCRPVTEQAGQALPPTMEKSRRTLRGSQLQAWHENDALLTYPFRHAISSRHSLYVLHQQTIRHARIAVTATLCTDKGSWALRHTLSHTKPQNFEIVHLVKT